MIEVILEFLLLLLIFIGVLALTYFVTKKMAVLNKNMTHNTNMKVIETIQISQGQYLYIVEIGGEFHLIGNSQKGHICYCTKLDKGSLNLEENITSGFKEQLSILMKGKQNNEVKEK